MTEAPNLIDFKIIHGKLQPRQGKAKLNNKEYTWVNYLEKYLLQGLASSEMRLKEQETQNVYFIPRVQYSFGGMTGEIGEDTKYNNKIVFDIISVVIVVG